MSRMIALASVLTRATGSARLALCVSTLAFASLCGNAFAEGPQVESQRPTGAETLPPELDWVYQTGDDRIYPILRQALYLEDHGKYEAAIGKYQELLSLGTLGNGVAPTFNSIAALYQRLGNPGEEVTWARKAVDALPEFPLSYINLGNGYLSMGELDQSFQAFRKYVVLRPNDPKGYYSLGLIAEQKQDFSKAEFYYQKSVRLDDNFLEGHYNLAAAYANQGKFADAAGELQKVIALDPLNDDARAMLDDVRKRQQP